MNEMLKSIISYFNPPQKSKREIFLESYFPYQRSPFPTYMINYITKKPSNAKGYQKLVQTCKYFFIRNPIIVVEGLSITGKVSSACLTIYSSSFYLTTQIETKFWITKEFRITGNEAAENYFIPNFYQIDAKTAEFKSTVIPFNLFIFLLPSIENLILSFDAVKNVTTGSLQKYIKKFENSNAVVRSNIYPLSDITPTSLKELLELPEFPKLNLLQIIDIPDTFDIVTFFTDVIKQNKVTKFRLDFCDSISDAYRSQLEAVVDEILSTENRDYRVPLIVFEGQDPEKFWKMQQLFCFN